MGESIEAKRARGREFIKRMQEKTAPVATNTNQRWTELEIEIILDYSLPVSEIATIIGRTYKAVRNKRDQLMALGIYIYADYTKEVGHGD